MKFLKTTLLYGCILGWISKILCRDCTFNVISFNSNNVFVDIKGYKYKMTKIDPDVPLYAVTIKNLENYDIIKYHYIADNEHEVIERHLRTYTVNTYNELFNRFYTIKHVPHLGFPTEDIWNNEPDSPIFDDSYTPTVIITDKKNRKFFHNGRSMTLPRVDIILKDSVYSFKKVKVESRDLRYNMFSFKIKLPDNGISGVRTLFFSTTETDPTMMHQLIYSDILQAIENPSSKAVPCRVYDKHGRGKGVYILQEDTTSKDFMVRHFLKTDGLTHDEISAKTGSILLGSPRADFYWSKNSKASKEYKEFKIIRNFLRKNETLHDLKHLSKALHDLNVGSKEEIEAFSNEWFDIPIFLKSLAVQYLAGNWNSYWMCLNNYVLYSNPLEITDSNDSKKIKHYFFENKVLYSFGTEINSEINQYGDELPKQTYNTLVDRIWGVYQDDSKYRIAIIKLLEGGLTKGMFEKYLVNIVKYIFNPVTMNNKIKALTIKLRDEVEWNSKLNRTHHGENGKIYTVEDFENEIEGESNKYNSWGLKRWIKERAEAIANEFGITWYPSVINKENSGYLQYVKVEPISHDDYMIELAEERNN
ncbi:hypothetical protein H8356DRAFT_1708581 [Neocallimastix lanati (nom. inval.)]|nr:hypothetical protein H8356DRAFT_1708581 [Neocallimastix sp. JGI-2020a]